PGAPRRSVGWVMVGRPLAPSFGAWDRSRHSPNLDEAFAGSPSPRGRGRGEGEQGTRSPGRLRFGLGAGGLPEALRDIEPFMISNRRLCRRSLRGITPL